MKKPMKVVMTDRSARESTEVLKSDAMLVDAVASISPPDPEVAATAKRRQFSGSERRRILAAADRCTAPGEIGALLRVVRSVRRKYSQDCSRSFSSHGRIFTVRGS